MASAADQMAQSISLAKFAQATDLKKRLWFTIGALIVFRLLSYVPLPGIDPTALRPAQPAHHGRRARLLQHLLGRLAQPHVADRARRDALYHRLDRRAAVDLAVAAARRDQEGRRIGRKKLNQYTRYGTVALTAIQGYFIAVGLEALGASNGLPR